jgi:hypothetical protein
MVKKLMLAALVALTLSAAHAEAGVRISFGIGLPIFAPPPRPVYVLSAPVYVAPAPVPVYSRYAPAPIYVRPAPAPVYVQPSPAPVYVQPSSIPVPR